MLYESNLRCVPLEGFKLLNPPKQIMGHDAPSDPDFEPECSYWTHDEAAILTHVVRGIRNWRDENTDGVEISPTVVDIGARFGWTAAAIARGGGLVYPVDPHLRLTVRADRFESNLVRYWDNIVDVSWLVAREFFSYSAGEGNRYTGFVIDGNHDTPEPLNDARGARKVAEPDAFVIFHDFWGQPIQDGVTWLIETGWNCRVYNTPNGVALCWRGFEGWTPPEHIADPNINWGDVRRSAAKTFDFERTV